MTTTTEFAPSTPPVAVDADALSSFVFRSVDDVGAALGCALAVMGDRLGYYRALAEHGPLTASDLAERTGTAQPYAREWLSAQAAGEILSYDPQSLSFSIPPEVAVAFTDESSPAFLPGFFQLAYGVIRDADRVMEAARAGDGVGWHDHNMDVHNGCERFFAPAYTANLVESWLPALNGVVDKLKAGASVADMGCGHGASTILMARTYPNSRFLGSDYHRPSIEVARIRARESGVFERISFQVAGSDAYSGESFDLVTTFDALHDMGDPVGAARHVYETLKDDGTWMIVEPLAEDNTEDNLHSRGRAFYGFSTLLCTPTSLGQDVGLALGTQAGPKRIRDVITAAGFTQFRVAATTPFNSVFEARK